MCRKLPVYSIGLFAVLMSGTVMATPSTDVDTLQQENRVKAEDMLNQAPLEISPQVRKPSPLETIMHRQKMKALHEEIQKRTYNTSPRNWPLDTQYLMDQYRSLSTQQPYLLPDTSIVNERNIPADMFPAMSKHRHP